MSARSAKTPRRRQDRSPVTQPQYLVVGKVLRPHGVRGELRLEIHSDTPAHLGEVETVYLGEAHRPRRLKSSRLHQGVILITLEGCEDRDRADALRGELVSVKFQPMMPPQAQPKPQPQLAG